MTTPNRRWPMIGAPTAAAQEPSGIGSSSPRSREDPRDYGLTAADLRAVADRLYDHDDHRLEWADDVSARFGLIRSQLRGLADAIDDGEPAP